MFDPALSRTPPAADTGRDGNHHIELALRDEAAQETRGGPKLRPRAASPVDGSDQLRGTQMNISPLDLRQQRFRTAFSGFDKVEVTSLLAAVADDYEQALREADRLRQDLARMEAALSEHREHEQNLRNTLLTAQRLSDEIKQHAEQEAKRIVREAEGRADMLLEKGQLRFDDVLRDIDGLKLKRREAEASIESIIQALDNTLDYVRERDGRDTEDKIRLHRPRQSGEASADDAGRDTQERRHAQSG